MANTVLRDVIVIGGLGIGLALGFSHKDKLYDVLGLTSQATQSEAAPQPRTKPVTKVRQGSVASIPAMYGSSLILEPQQWR